MFISVLHDQWHVRYTECMKMLKILAASQRKCLSYKTFADIYPNLGTVCVISLVAPNTSIYQHHHSRDCGREQEILLSTFLMNLCWHHQQKLIMLCFSLMKKKGLTSFVLYGHDLYLCFCNGSYFWCNILTLALLMK